MEIKDFAPEFDGSPVIFCDKTNHWFGEGENRKQVLFDIRLRRLARRTCNHDWAVGLGKDNAFDFNRRTPFDSGWPAQCPRPEFERTLASSTGTCTSRHRVHLSVHNLFDSLSALQNTCLPLELFGLPKKEQVRRATEILERLDMGHRLHYKPESLSGDNGNEWPSPVHWLGDRD